MPFGAAVVDGGVRFRLWAPAMGMVALMLEDPRASSVALPMTPVGGGWHELVTDRATVGSRYRFQLEDGQYVPDPASRFQPDDVHGPSEVIDPAAYAWQDHSWRGRPWEEVVLYELHAGAFTPAGTFRSAIERLDHLVALGVTAVELMPIADFPGGRNWGYDGVFPFAPDAGYGRPDDLKALVDGAHARGLMVFLDVVYNHFGPEGNYLHLYAPQCFTDRHRTPWGAAINFDGPESRVVRDFFVHNALYWLEEFHFDGLRLDAVHAIRDDSTPDILEELAQAVRAGPGRARHVHLVLENDDNAARYLRRGYDAQWNDDLHHALHVLLTSEREGYYADYADRPLYHLGRCLTEGFAYQDEPSAFRDGRRRGESTRGIPPVHFVSFLQNHDQVGNRAFGERIGALADEAAVRAATAIVLLAPSPPLLFMGEEWGACEPFLYFCDFGGELARQVTDGRRREFARFAAFADPATRARIPDPNARETFERPRLDWHSCESAAGRRWLAHYRELLALRAREVVPRLKGMPADRATFRLIGASGIEVNWVLGDGSRYTLIANLGSAPLALDVAGGGRRIYANAEIAHGIAPPWCVQWSIGSPTGPKNGSAP
jgi:malto-oligosyltrehalose trehalohydrolase